MTLNYGKILLFDHSCFRLNFIKHIIYAPHISVELLVGWFTFFLDVIEQVTTKLRIISFNDLKHLDEILTDDLLSEIQDYLTMMMH